MSIKSIEFKEFTVYSNKHGTVVLAINLERFPILIVATIIFDRFSMEKKSQTLQSNSIKFCF